jgi:hypothetical protein
MYIIKDLQTGLYYSKFSHKERYTSEIVRAQRFSNYDRATVHCKDFLFVVDIKKERVNQNKITYKIRVQGKNYYKQKRRKVLK